MRVLIRVGLLLTLMACGARIEVSTSDGGLRASTDGGSGGASDGTSTSSETPSDGASLDADSSSASATTDASLSTIPDGSSGIEPDGSTTPDADLPDPCAETSYTQNACLHQAFVPASSALDTCRDASVIAVCTLLPPVWCCPRPDGAP